MVKVGTPFVSLQHPRCSPELDELIELCNCKEVSIDMFWNLAA